MKVLYLVTGSCPQTEAEARLEFGELTGQQLEYEAVVARMRDQWADRTVIGQTRRALSGEIVGPDPDALVEPLASPEHPLFWHEPRRDDTVVCPCGHFASYLCDTPIGRGRTCDRPMCRCCRNEIAPNIDRCPYHVAVSA